jgi:filamentous hemagglutinin family protein
MMCMFFLLHILSVLYGIQAIPQLNSCERQRRSAHFCLSYKELNILLGISGVNLPPAILTRIRMASMKRLLVTRLLRNEGNVNLHVRLIISSFDLAKFTNFVYDPTRFSLHSFTDRNCQNPTACRWHPQRELLLVTTYDAIFAVSIGRLVPQQRRFNLLYRVLQGNFSGIDVSVDGLIVVIGYNTNLIHLLNPNGSIVGSYPIVNAHMRQQLRFSSVCFSHNGRYILCASDKDIQVVDISGNFICTLGSFGAKPGFFRDIGQISRLPGDNQYVITEYKNNRAQIVEIDIPNQTLTIFGIFGNNLFINPIGLAVMGNCVVVFSRTERMIYVYTKSGEVFEVPINIIPGTNLACTLPDGRIVFVNQEQSLVTFMSEDLSMPLSSQVLRYLENL